MKCFIMSYIVIGSYLGGPWERGCGAGSGVAPVISSYHAASLKVVAS